MEGGSCTPSAVVIAHEESIAHRTGEYEDLRLEASASPARSRTPRRNSRTPGAAWAPLQPTSKAHRESLAERERTLGDTLERLHAVENEASARERRLEELLAERERVVPKRRHARMRRRIGCEPFRGARSGSSRAGVMAGRDRAALGRTRRPRRQARGPAATVRRTRG